MVYFELYYYFLVYTSRRQLLSVYLPSGLYFYGKSCWADSLPSSPHDTFLSHLIMTAYTDLKNALIEPGFIILEPFETRITPLPQTTWYQFLLHTYLKLHTHPIALKEVFYKRMDAKMAAYLQINNQHQLLLFHYSPCVYYLKIHLYYWSELNPLLSHKGIVSLTLVEPFDMGGEKDIFMIFYVIFEFL